MRSSGRFGVSSIVPWPIFAKTLRRLGCPMLPTVVEASSTGKGCGAWQPRPRPESARLTARRSSVGFEKIDDLLDRESEKSHAPFRFQVALQFAGRKLCEV